jgi:hypothetical protein
MPDAPSITVVTAMRNEGPFILEWIAHHLALGVTSVVVVTNDCDDGSDTLLDRLAPAGVVHLRQDTRPGRVQWAALEAAEATEAVRGAAWVLAIDCDEFVTLRPPLSSLPDLIAAAGEADAIVLPWRFFGHSHRHRFEDAPTTLRFTRAIPEDALFPGVARCYKTLARWRDGPFRRLGVHRPKTRNGAAPVWLDGSGRRLPEEFAADDRRILLMTPRIESALVQLNHYSLRSAEDFLVKRARGLPNRKGKPLDAAYWAERNFNTIEDTSIFRHREGTERELTRLRDLPGVPEAHAAAVAAHQAKIDALLATAEGATLYSRLVLLDTSVPPPPEVARRLLSLVSRAKGPGDAAATDGL